MKKKEIVYTLVSVILAVLSIWTVISQTRNYSFVNLKRFFVEANPLWILIAICCMLGYIVFEALAILCILKAFGYKRSLNKGVIYSAADIYFSAITPSASGGQPASAFFMGFDGIPTGVVTATLVLNLIMYTSSIITIGITALVINPWMFSHFNTFSRVLILIGYAVLSALTVFFVVLIKNENIVRSIFHAILKVLNKLHIVRRMDMYEKKLEKSIVDYKNCAEMIDGQRSLLVKCFLCNLVQRLSQILVPVMVFLADGGKIKGGVDVFVTQVFVTIGSNCIPIPGAMGVSDYLLIDGLRELLSVEDATNMELASRGISFYTCVLISLIIVAIGYFAVRKKDNATEDEG